MMKSKPRSRRQVLSISALAALLLGSSPAAVLSQTPAAVTIDPETRYQTILGWGCASYLPEWLPPRTREEYIEQAVDGLGLTRLRMEGTAGNRSNRRSWEWLNDNGDPEVTDWSRLNTESTDQLMVDVVLPFKARVEARGEPFELYVSPSFFDGGSSGSAPVWLLKSPGEYAEFALSIILRLRDVHGVEATHYAILNEAGNNNAFSAAVVAAAIKILGPKLRALGLSTTIEFPECVNAQTSWNYVHATKDDDDMWSHVGIVTYHLYGTNDPYRQQLRDFALAKGLPTGQTEFMGLNLDHIHDDLTLGGVSVWEVYGLGSQFDFHYNRVARTGQYWSFRQLLRYVRPGAVRIEAVSSDPALRPLAFVSGGKVTAVLLNGAGSRAVTISGLPAGTYAVCRSVGAAPYQERGLQSVAGGPLTVDAPSESVVTVYPHPGGNLPPSFTEWNANPDHLRTPASAATLTAAAVDPELDAISFSWSVAEAPAGAPVALATPLAAKTAVSGLTVPGEYTFRVEAADPTHSVAREVRVSLFAANQPPIPIDVHNRNPVQITLPTSATSLRGGGWDLEGDALTYAWRVLAQPGGAAVSLATPSAGSCAASGLTVPGDYVFTFDVSDGTSTVTAELTVPVYPVNAPPVISQVAAAPSTVDPPATGTALTAATSDPDGDVITHWWSVKRCPAGAKPVVTSPGSPDTPVTGLTRAGSYTFTLLVADRAAAVTKDLTVTATASAPSFRRGDSNADGALDIADPVATLFHLFLATADLPCLDAADADDSGTLEIADAIHDLNFLFRGGSAPSAPFPDCGVDPTIDGLGCTAYPACP